MKVKSFSHFLFPILIFFIALIPLGDLFHPGLLQTHDGENHVVRIASFYQDLKEGTIIPRWDGNLNWGYGHPVSIFLYPLPSYFASMFRAFGASPVDSVKIVFGLAFILSGLAMYLWLQAFLPKLAAVCGSLLYLFAPYRFVEIYVRGDIGEHLAFVFPPLVLYFLYKSSLHNRLKYWYLVGGGSALAGLILAHNAVSLMFLPVIFLYAFYLFLQTKQKKQVILSAAIIIAAGFALSAFFWIPALLEGKYTLREIVIENDYAKNFVTISQLFYGKWSYGLSGQLSVQIGILQWLVMFASLLALGIFLKKKASGRKPGILLAGCLLTFLASLCLMLPVSKVIWDHISLLQKFQFPWRFLAVTVFITAVSGAITLSLLPKKILMTSAILLAVLLLYFNNTYWHAKGYLQKPDEFYTGIFAGTTDTGENAPIWSVRFMEHFPKAHLEVISGSAKITELKRTSAQHSYIVSATKNTRLRENTLYFPGWQIFVDGQSVPIQFQDVNSRGIMTFSIPAGEHKVSALFGETKVRSFADEISLVGLLALAALAFCGIFVRFRKK